MTAVWKLLKMVADVASIKDGRLYIPIKIDVVDSFDRPIEIGVVPTTTTATKT